MKKNLIKVLILFFSTPLFASYNPEFMKFLLKMVHNYNFYNCDNAIKKTISTIGGSDARVDVSIFPGIKDQIRITTVFGHKNDSVYVYTVIRKTNNRCYINENSMLTYNESCMQYQQEQEKNWHYTATSLDFYWFQNKGKVDMILKPLDNSCIVNYNLDTFYPQDK